MLALGARHHRCTLLTFFHIRAPGRVVEKKGVLDRQLLGLMNETASFFAGIAGVEEATVDQDGAIHSLEAEVRWRHAQRVAWCVIISLIAGRVSATLR